MSSMLNSQGLVLATAMAVSAGTVFLFELFRDKNLPVNEEDSSPDSRKAQKSCLCSESKKNEKKKKKKVQFAKDVKDSTGNGEWYRKQQEQRIKHAVKNHQSMICGKENEKGLGKIPANRMALYNGILKNRVQYSH